MAHLTEDKNFRLPLTVRPQRYAATVTLNLQQKKFEGEQRIELQLQGPARELILHAVDLELAQVSLQAGGKTYTPKAVRKVPVSGTVVLELDAEIPAGAITLAMSWSGAFNTGLRGLYDAEGVAATQFEAADARRLFPCFDEPAFKAHWAITARVPPGVTVLSNGDILKDESDGPLRKVTFRETELLSSYLVALVCGPLVGTEEGRAGETPVRTFSVPGKAHLAHFSQEVALAALPRLQEYFGIPYAFGKVDQVGLPQFEAGAMENAGLITYRETALLLDPATAPLAVQKRVAETVTHELAHQWFGNWVTMVWWDDLWLNEAFATWMASKIVDGWRPKWRVWLDFDAGKAAALHLDALKSTHPIRGVVRNADEAGESFDLITYEKGGAVLRMIEGFLGDSPFREGIRRYMKKHARANAVADDLWGALAEASQQPVVELANAWIRQSGFPIVSVSVQGSQVSLKQRRFYSEPGVVSPETWPVPMVLRFGDGKGVREQRVLFDKKELTVPLDGGVTPTWLCANGGSTGFYRVAYDDAGLSKLMGNLGALAPAERIALVADRWAQVRADLAPLPSFLELISAFGQEEDEAVLEEVVGRLSYLEARLVEGEDLGRFRGFVEKLLGHQLARLGWDAGAGEQDPTKLRRATIIRAVGGIARSGAALQEGRPRVAKLLSGTLDALEPNMVDTVLHLVARSGDAALFDVLLNKFPEEKDPASKRRYLLALTSFEAPELLGRAQELIFSGRVPQQELSYYFGGLMGNRVGRRAFWQQAQRKWPALMELVGRAPMLVRKMVEALGHLQGSEQLDEVKAFLKGQRLDEVQQAVSQTLERLEQDVAFRERTKGQVGAWLR